jgi:antitoxin (DNA-binding transcriptional repressor) of toxin-antitoxin stability system
VAAGEEITITRSGEEIARLVPAQATSTRQFGLDRGRWTVSDDFDSPLSDEVLAVFEG